ncbi:polysaccharide biosynthesis tyrosine autokinase [Rosenbergiella australiborealis]|uniref:polysaccharide biosynthesis tyrosine autokinase n=1 Tax=Rosenbergiella australiborealis TaxID=1544696 RepID=UPI001F4D8F50|nr:polysaccharide biosynthesis tyrosine autokinase [Rosenbergiella australiborealis]
MTSELPPQAEANEIDLGQIIGELIDHKKLILLVTSISIIVAIIYAIFTTPIYQADALIQVEQRQDNTLLDSLNKVLPESQPISAPEIALLQSRMILGKTVDDLNLQAKIQQHYFPIIGRGWSRLMGEKSGKLILNRFYLADDKSKKPLIVSMGKNNRFTLHGEGINLQGEVGKAVSAAGVSIEISTLSAPAGTEFAITKTTRLDAITQLQGALKISEMGEGSGILNLKLTNDDGELAQRELDSISENYLEQNIARQAAQDSKSLDFLQQQLPIIRQNLDNAESKLSNYRKQSDSVDLNLQARSALEQIVNVDDQLNQLTFREAEISQLFTKDHPTYIALLEKRRTLESEKKRLNKQVASLPAAQQQVLMLSRDVDSGRAVYMQLLNRQQELTIAKNSAIGNVRIIDSAVTPSIPIKPNKKIIILAGLVLGVVLSCGLVLVRIFLRNGLMSVEQIEELGISVYATIPESKMLVNLRKKTRIKKNNKNDRVLLAEVNPTDEAIEAIRGLRTSLYFSMMEDKDKVIMLSGASPSTGKSFISTNLAIVLAETSQRVLLIDGDMRKGYIHKSFSVENNCGLSTLLTEKENYHSYVKKSKSSNIDIITRGLTPPNPAELLMSQRLKGLIEWANDNYDIIIIDTPPILAVTDAAIISRYANTNLLVTRYELNSAKEVMAAIRRFEQNGIKVKGTIFNAIRETMSSYYSYGYKNTGYSYKMRN